MKKRSIFVLLAVLLCLICIFALASCGEKKGELEYKLNEDGKSYTVVGIGTESGDVVIPNSYQGKRVTGIEGAFYDCDSLTSITIPSNVTSISSAFYDCDNLASVTVKRGNAVFHSAGNCLIETASKTVIAGCKNSIIPTDGSVTTIGEFAFYYCKNLASITIPSSVTDINSQAFCYCNSLKSVIFAENSQLKSIGTMAFAGCSSLTSITIPSSVKSIGAAPFTGCGNLESIAVESGNTKYHSTGNCLIETASRTLLVGCDNSVIPTDGSVTSIGSYAFDGCSSLTSLMIPCRVTNIHEDAFRGCHSLESIAVESGNTKYHSAGNCLIETASKTLILGCKNSVIPTDGSVTSIGSYAFYGCSDLTSITIPSSVTSIDFSAFERCSSLTSITIPSGVTSIDYSVFAHCGNLESITVENGNTVYHSAGNCLIETASKTLLAGCKNSVIPADGSVTSISFNVFTGCNGLTSLVIPASVTNICDDAFSGCTGLTTVTFGENSQLTSIGDNAFRDCSGLTSITIPASVTSIGSAAFFGCDSLTSITIPASVISIGSYAFYNCTGLTSVIFETTEGWWRSTSSSDTSGTPFSASDLANASTAATYLSSTYFSSYWKRG